MKRMKRYKVIDELVADEMDAIMDDPSSAEDLVRSFYEAYTNEDLKEEYEEFHEEKIKIVD